MGRGRWYMVSLLATLYIVSYLDRVIITLMVEPLKSDFRLSDTQMGLLIGPAFAILFAVISLPLSWLVDRGNRKRYLLAGVALWSLCTTLAGFATSFPMLFALRMGLAVGEAVLSPVALSMIGDLFEKGERSLPSAIYVSSGNVGIVGAYIVGGAIIAFASQGELASSLGLTLAPWRISLVMVGLPGLFLAALVLFTTREPARRQVAPASHDGAPLDPERFGIFASFGECLRFYIPAIIACALVFAILNGSVAWYPTHLIRTQGVSASVAGYIFGTAILGSLIPMIAIPILSERIARIGRKDLMLLIPLIQLPLGLVCFILALWPSSLLASAMLMAAGYILLSSLASLPMIAIPQMAPPAFRGRLMGLMAFANNIMGFGVSVSLIGFMSDHLFSGPESLGNSLLAIAYVAGPAAWLLFFLAWKPYRTAVSRSVNAPA